MITEWLIPLVTGLAVALIGGIILAMVNKIMSSVAEDLTEFKSNTEEQFARLTLRQDEHDKFREQFLSKGWTSLPDSLNSGPALSSTLANMEARLTAIDVKLESYGNRLTEHDRWERAQKYPHSEE